MVVSTTCTRIFTVCLRCCPHNFKEWMLLVASSCLLASFMSALSPELPISWPAQSLMTSAWFPPVSYFVRRIVIAIFSCSIGPLDTVHQLVLRLYNNFLAIWPAIGSDNLCISSKVYDIIQYLINKFFHSLPDWIFCFYNLVSCVFLNLEPLRGDWLAGYFVSGSPVVIAQRFGMEYLPFSSSFSQWVRGSSIGRTVRLVEYCNFLLA